MHFMVIILFNFSIVFAPVISFERSHIIVRLACCRVSNIAILVQLRFS